MGEARRRRLLAQQSPSQAQATASPAPSAWPLGNAGRQQELERWFDERGIDFSRPGLHDTPAFLRAEQRFPRALEFMARYVEARAYTPPELADARHKIQIAAEAVATRLARDGRPGQCVSAASGLSRMLDELGVWNFVAKANVSVRFPPELGAGSRFFYSVDLNMPEAPHAIVVAPPFTIVDPSIKYQAYETSAMAASVPGLVISDEMQAYHPRFTELISPEICEYRGLGEDEQSLERFVRRHHAAMLEVMEQLPPRQVPFGAGGSLGYTIVAVAGYAERLRDCVSPHCQLDGLTPPEIFRRDVLPRLS